MPLGIADGGGDVSNHFTHYAGGAFYLQQPQGFQVVPPSLGITAPYLPAGAAPVSINGVLYYQASGAYFLPVMENGATVFTTVQP